MATLSSDRNNAVSDAWKRERGLVSRGYGSRPWTKREQSEIMRYGRVRGYQGHHMKSVTKYPEYARDPKNIQFLRTKGSNNEHINQGHKGNYKTPSNGKYSYSTGKKQSFGNNPPRQPRAQKLDNAVYNYKVGTLPPTMKARRAKPAARKQNQGQQTSKRSSSVVARTSAPTTGKGQARSNTIVARASGTPQSSGQGHGRGSASPGQSSGGRGASTGRGASQGR